MTLSGGYQGNKTSLCITQWNQTTLVPESVRTGFVKRATSVKVLKSRMANYILNPHGPENHWAKVNKFASNVMKSVNAVVESVSTT